MVADGAARAGDDAILPGKPASDEHKAVKGRRHRLPQ